MPTTIVTGPDGREYEVTHPAGASRQEIIAYAKKNAASLPAPEQKPQGVRSDPAGIVDAGLSVASSMIAEPVAGLAGLVSAPFMGVDDAVENIDSVREALTYQPRTQQGQSNLEALGGLLAPIGDLFNSASQATGDAAYELFGESPTAGAIGAAVPEAIASLVPGTLAARQGKRIEAAAEAARQRDRISPALLDQEGSVGSAAASDARSGARSAESLPVPLDGDAALTQGQATRNPAQWARERNLAKEDVGAALAQRFENQQGVLEDNLRWINDGMNRAPAQALDNDYAFGAAIKQHLGNRRKAVKEKTNDLYEQAEKAGDLDSLINIDALGAAFKSLKDENFDVSNPGEIKKLAELAERTGVLKGPVTINNAEKFRQSINQFLPDPLDPNHKRMAGILKSPVDAALDATDSAPAYKQARQAYRKYKQEFDGNALTKRLTSNKAKTDSPQVGNEKVFSAIEQASIDDVRKMMRSVAKSPGGVEMIHGLGQRVMMGIMEKTLRGNGFNHNQFSREIAKLDRSGKLDALYGRERAQQLRDLSETANRVGQRPFGAAVNDSNTAPTIVKRIADIFGDIPGVRSTPVLGGALRVGRDLGNKYQRSFESDLAAEDVKRALDLQGLLSYE